ncbi:MAG TPA: sigma-70 family RNA polymerase sigma factor [candidate division WOR-3 bacterium]|uniref:Sigma-70 family RNA polymerase sigma factor n=1 Tax=candidate division WOR-3 bacterium TaxID=2052148 RepID=A0A9C9ENA0_UNCW3|nr:sigma-70 family RNA polymerase sigma factor [candidate division WOR-3 bacterium]
MKHDREQVSDLIEKALKHDEGACRKIVDLYKGRIFSYVYRMVGNYHDAEDLTFDTFIKCFKALASFDRTKKFSTWLFTIAHNTTMDFFRKNRYEYEYFDERHSVKDDFVEKVEEAKKMELIERCLAELPALDREVILLFHREEYSYQEISEILKLPVTTIKTRLHRARKRLRTLVRKKKKG